MYGTVPSAVHGTNQQSPVASAVFPHSLPPDRRKILKNCVNRRRARIAACDEAKAAEVKKQSEEKRHYRHLFTARIQVVQYL